MFDPHTCTIQGDLSRNDVLVLDELCRGKRVVEFGCGGSTTLLAQMASRLDSYDTDSYWQSLVQGRLEELGIPVGMHLSAEVPYEIPERDVLFIDGYFGHRVGWLLRFAVTTPVVVLHDSRGAHWSDPSLRPVLDQFFANHHRMLAVERIDFHYRDSNMLVLRMRRDPVQYVNWNDAERERRTGHHETKFIP